MSGGIGGGGFDTFSVTDRRHPCIRRKGSSFLKRKEKSKGKDLPQKLEEKSRWKRAKEFATFRIVEEDRSFIARPNALPSTIVLHGRREKRNQGRQKKDFLALKSLVLLFPLAIFYPPSSSSSSSSSSSAHPSPRLSRHIIFPPKKGRPLARGEKRKEGQVAKN